MIPYFNCHSHTYYSNIRLLDCINKPSDLIDTAIHLGLSGIAITDHECLSAHMEVNQYAKEIKEKYPDFKIALGNEIYLVDERAPKIKYYHFILLAKDAIGHKALRELSTIAWKNLYVDRRMERVPTTKEELFTIVNKYKGHLIATSACAGGELSTLALQFANEPENQIILRKIKEFIQYCLNLFGEDFYIECAPSAFPDQCKINKVLYQLSQEYNIKMTIGLDAHYLTKKDRFIHKAYLNSKNGDREVDSFYEFTYLMNSDECTELLRKSLPDVVIQEFFKNTIEIQNKIQEYDLERKQIIPKVEVHNYQKGSYPWLLNKNKYPILFSLINSDEPQERYWINECLLSLHQKGLEKDDYYARLETEADIIRTIGNKLEDCLFAYFNTFKHYIDLFWDCGSIVGPGRGSATGFLSNYLLGITQLDPIRWDIKYWRFLNKERVELPSLILILGSCKKRTLTIA